MKKQQRGLKNLTHYPLKIFSFFYQKNQCYRRINPEIDPISIISSIDIFPKKINKRAFSEIAEHKPSRPSIILKAFIMPAQQKTVKGIPKIPRSIAPKYNKSGSKTIYISVANIKPKTSSD